MNDEEARIYQQLLLNLNNAIQFKRVAEEGVEQEKFALQVYKAQFDSIFEAVDFVKSSECRIVSITEFRSLRGDIARAKFALAKANEIVGTLEQMIQDYDIDIRDQQNRINKFVAMTRRGIVLKFKEKPRE